MCPLLGEGNQSGGPPRVAASRFTEEGLVAWITGPKKHKLDPEGHNPFKDRDHKVEPLLLGEPGDDAGQGSARIRLQDELLLKTSLVLPLPARLSGE